jgi:hypothetical protein
MEAPTPSTPHLKTTTSRPRQRQARPTGPFRYQGSSPRVWTAIGGLVVVSLGLQDRASGLMHSFSYAHSPSASCVQPPNPMLSPLPFTRRAVRRRKGRTPTVASAGGSWRCGQRLRSWWPSGRSSRACPPSSTSASRAPSRASSAPSTSSTSTLSGSSRSGKEAGLRWGGVVVHLIDLSATLVGGVEPWLLARPSGGALIHKLPRWTGSKGCVRISSLPNSDRARESLSPSVGRASGMSARLPTQVPVL